MQKFHLFTSDTMGSYIVSTSQPFYIGKIRKFENDLEWAEFTNNYKGLGLAQIVPFKIAVEISKSLSGLMEVGSIQTPQSIAVQMADYFTDNVVKPNLTKFEKYLF